LRLPTASKTVQGRPVSSDDPARMAELEFQQRMSKDLPADKIPQQDILKLAPFVEGTSAC